MTRNRSAVLLIAAGFALAVGWGQSQEATEYIHEKGQPFSGKDLEKLCENRSFVKLDLRGAGLVDADLRHLAGLADLKELRIDSHRLTPKGYEVLQELKKVTILGIGNTSGSELPAVFPFIKDLPLVELDLSECRDFTGAGLENLHCQGTLQKLDLSCFRGVLTDKGLASLEGFTELRDLDLNGHEKIKKGVRFLEGMSKLEHLNLYGCVGIEDAGYTALFKKLTNLKSLNLGFCWWHEGKGLVFPASLVDLNLIESKRLSDEAFADFPCKANLVNVNLFQCLPMTDKGVAAFQDMKQLKRFNIGCIRALTNESLKSIGGNTGLTELNISDNDNFDDEGLAHLEELTRLEVLNLWHLRGITGSGLSHLRGMSALKELNLADCHNLEDAAFPHIKSLPELETLYLDNCRGLTDKAINTLSGKTSLKTLTLSGCENLSDSALTAIGSLVSLEYLDISNCVGFSDEGVRKIRKALPDCSIVR